MWLLGPSDRRHKMHAPANCSNASSELSASTRNFAQSSKASASSEFWRRRSSERRRPRRSSAKRSSNSPRRCARRSARTRWRPRARSKSVAISRRHLHAGIRKVRSVPGRVRTLRTGRSRASGVGASRWRTVRFGEKVEIVALTVASVRLMGRQDRGRKRRIGKQPPERVRERSLELGIVGAPEVEGREKRVGLAFNLS